MNLCSIFFAALFYVKSVLSSESNNAVIEEEMSGIEARQVTNSPSEETIISIVTARFGVDKSNCPIYNAWLESLNLVLLKYLEDKYQYSGELKSTSELLQLTALLIQRPWVKPGQVFSHESRFIPQSQEAVDLVLGSIQDYLRDRPDEQLGCFTYFVERLLKYESFELLAYLIEKIPANLFALPLWPNEKSLYKLGKEYPLALSKFLETRNGRRFVFVLPCILFMPVSDEINSLVSLRRLLGLPNEYEIRSVLVAIGESCLLEFETHSTDQRDLIYKRNLELIRWLQDLSLLVESQDLSSSSQIKMPTSHVRLFNEIRFGPNFASIREREALFDANLPSETVVTHDSVLTELRSLIPTYTNAYYPSRFIEVSILAQRYDIFQTILEVLPPINDYERSIFLINTYRFLADHSNFVRLLPVECRKKLQEMMRVDTVEMLHVMKFNDKEYPKAFYKIELTSGYVKNLLTHADLYVVSEEFNTILRQYASLLGSDGIGHVMLTLIDKFKNPVPFFADILEFVPAEHNFYINFALGKEKFLRALLAVEDSDPALTVLSKFKIPIQSDLVKVLLNDEKFAAEIISDRGNFIRKHFNLSLSKLIRDNDLSYEQILRILEILRVPVNDRSFSLYSESDDCSWAKFYRLINDNGDLEDIVKFAAYPGFLAYLTRLLYVENDLSNRVVYHNMHSNTPNLLALKSLEMFEHWLRVDKESFRRFCPKVVAQVLMPESS